MESFSLEQLAHEIRRFKTGDTREGYDLVGAAHLLGACLDNLRMHATAEQVAEIQDYLEPHHIEFLQEITNPGRSKNELLP